MKELLRDGELDDALGRELPKIGSIAGYPKLPLNFWDSENFFLLPVLIIFEGTTGADAAWLDHVHDRDKCVVTTSESGFVNAS